MRASSDSTLGRLEDQDDPSPLLPLEMIWLYFVAPLAAAPLLDKDFFTLPLAKSLHHVAAGYPIFFTLALALHSLYIWVMPGLVRRLRTPLARGVLHVAVGSGVPLVMVILVIHPLKVRLGAGLRYSMAQDLLVATLISWMFLFPGLIVQRLRNTAARIERRALLAQRAALEAQLSALQARIQPHFFFNSLNTVASLISENPELAERTLERLAELFRYALDSGKSRFVSLERELDMTRDYLAIQTARYGARLRTHLAVDEQLTGISLPPLVLQPLVENAILHGMDRREGVSVRVLVRGEETWLHIEVIDDGPGPGASGHQGAQTGVKDLRERLRLLYGEQGTLTLEPVPGGGCRARLSLPSGGPLR
ncbi:sensor histidine kinase [Cystobacter fuscus]|uniref:sensor histidine kinase n=1 Tax=Cystobacter fuscus TaxID=43 RepID=UPI002B28DA73|nr:sensor histidine kinase [Cystobacter fuscus]